MIIGLTDNFNALRRDGKIRAGTRDEASGKMDNSSHFLLHDSPQLIPVLGEHPTEIYFTVYTDNVNGFFRPSLRYYTKTELMCVSTHETGKANAAYLAFGDAPGVKQNAHPTWPKARERSCLYKSCPQYLEGKCGEHFFLDMIVPQYSMGSVFTLENTSILAVLNIDSAIKKATLASGGKLAGQIFRLYKKSVPVAFTDVSKAKKYNRDQAVIHMDYVPFEFIPEAVKQAISPDNLNALVGLRSGAVQFGRTLPLPDHQPQIETQTHAALPSPDDHKKAEEEIKARANDPTVIKLIDELSALIGVPNSEDNRIKLARNVTPPSVEGIANYVRAKIQKAKSEAKKAEQPKVETQAVIPPPVSTPAAQAAPGNLF